MLFRPLLSRVAPLVLGVAAVAFPLAIAWRTYLVDVNVFFPPRRPLQLERTAARIQSLASVQIPSGSERIGAWYAPAANGATVVLCHGAGGDRSQLVPEARTLAESGFGVLLFDWPGNGESGGESDWNQTTRSSLVAVLDWLERRPEVDPRRIGAVGFSLGGYSLVQVAVQDSRIGAMALVGTPSDLNEQIRLSHQSFRWVRVPVGRWTLERHGIDLNRSQPVDIIHEFAARPLLVIGGAQDHTVPMDLTRSLFEAARKPKQLLVLSDVGHSDYARVGAHRYLSAIVEHFASSLRPSSPPATRR